MCFVCFKQKTAYEMRIRDWSSDVCSSDLSGELSSPHAIPGHGRFRVSAFVQRDSVAAVLRLVPAAIPTFDELGLPEVVRSWSGFRRGLVLVRSEERRVGQECVRTCNDGRWTDN